jgi:valyl-tRNA synthetase
MHFLPRPPSLRIGMHPLPSLLSPWAAEAVLEAFIRLHDKGLIYRGSYMVNWSPGLQTAVSDLEVEYTEEAGSLYFFKYPVAGADVWQCVWGVLALDELWE